MKVRLLNAVAIATTVLGAQAFAQESERGLERALADLNNGYVVPAGGNVNATGSLGLNISGDMRVRNTWVNPAATLMPNGAASDEKNFDARMNLNLAFDVNEGASVMVTVNAAENWGTAGGLGNLATGEGTAAVPGSTNLTPGVINQAYYTAYDVFGDGGEFKLGRSYYTLGSGRILATDDWNQTPDSYSGIWYHNSWEDVNFELFMITDVFSGVGLNGSRTPTGDVDLYGLYVDFTTDAIDFLGELTIAPYFLRSSIQASPFNLAVAGLPITGGAKNWWGIEISGNAFDNILAYDVEAVFVNSNVAGAPTTSNFNAWAVDVNIDLEQLLGEMPAQINPVLELGAAFADNAGITINPAYHNTAGLADVLGTSGGYGPGAAGGPALFPLAFVGSATGGGVWNGLADTFQGALRIEPVEDWYGRLAIIHFDDNTFGTVLPGDATEIDLSVTHTLTPSGVNMYLGWARVDFNSLTPNAYVVYAVFSLPF
jgi:hypothetical protein